jgi:hypothetical protein
LHIENSVFCPWDRLKRTNKSKAMLHARKKMELSPVEWWLSPILHNERA